ncbi:MAG: hypothetical protein IJR93_12185 [Treponema sp.]|nr:hypothetical protein [Treponema sp.]
MQSINPTSYGKFLKRLRIDTGDTVPVMAQKLGVSVSLLSSVESGAREIPVELSEKIRTTYRLDAEASDALLRAECETLHKSIAISLGQHEGDETFKKAAISISRDLQQLSAEEVQKIAAEIHHKAQAKRQAEFSGWAALGLAAVALGVGVALAAASTGDRGGLNGRVAEG